MKVIKHEGNEERHAIVALVLDPKVLAEVAPSWEGKGFGSRWANLVAQWAVDHWNKYKTPPTPGDLEGIFTAWSPTADDALVRIVEDWLSNLPGESTLNSDYAIDRIRQIVQQNAIHSLGVALTGLTEQNRLEDAQNVLALWKAPRIGQEASGVFPLQDANLVDEAFQTACQEPLIQYPGALGEFFGPVLAKDAFVAFLAPEKTGKTTVLLDLAWRGVAQGKRVAFISCGDMSQSQVIARLIPRVCKSPISGGLVSIPVSVTYENKEPRVVWEQTTTRKVSKEDAKKAFVEAGGDDPSRFRLLTYPAGTVTASDITSLASRWADEGWTPEIIVIDYADILALPRGIKETRDGIDANWKELRALSTQFRCLVATATQSDTEGYSTWLLSKKNFSDCKKKVAHVTAMIGLNMTEQERRMQVCRYNYVALREAEFMAQKPVYISVAGCTKVGRPSMVSAWPTD
jgi:hypothetical protein